METFRASCTQLLLLALSAATCLAQPPKFTKMSSALVYAIRSAQSQVESAQPVASNWSLGGVVQDATGVQVYIQMVEVTESALADLRALGVNVEVTDPAQRLVQARVPLTQLEAVASLSSTTLIRLPDYGLHNRQGSVGTQGDAIVRAHLRRQEFGATGAGVLVGVISDGLNGLSASISSGDLPVAGITMPAAPLTGGGISLDSPLPGGTVFTSTPVGRPDLTAGSEGRAILEIIHDISPGAQLFFAPGLTSSLGFRRAVKWLVAQGVMVIADDIVFLNVGSYDGTSVVSQEAAAAVASGTSYFTAVGNDAQRHYRGLFTDTDGDTFHEFDVSLGLPMVDNGGETLNVTVQPGETIRIFLQWDDPFGASANDYDLCVHDPADLPSSPSPVPCSMNPQTGSQNPTELLAITRSAPTPGTLGVRINKVGMAAPRVFDLFIIGGVMNEFVVPEGSVPNKSDAGGGVISVGAVDWLTPHAVEFFSSRGPTRDGRLKPEIVAPDGVSTSVPGLSPFFGTSAAAPHAAGVAALLLSQNPGLTPSQLADQLMGTATDLGPPGPDTLAGFGRVDAFPTAPRGMIAFDRSLYRTGDTLHLSATLQPGSALNAGDAYVFAALPPDGSSLLSLVPDMGGGFTGAGGLHPLALGFPVPSFSGEFFNFTFSGNEPPGLYLVLGVMTRSGQTPLPLDADHLDQTIIFDGTFFEFSP